MTQKTVAEVGEYKRPFPYSLSFILLIAILFMICSSVPGNDILTIADKILICILTALFFGFSFLLSLLEDILDQMRKMDATKKNKESSE